MRDDCFASGKKCKALIENLCDRKGGNCPFYKSKEQYSMELSACAARHQRLGLKKAVYSDENGKNFIHMIPIPQPNFITFKRKGA